MLRKRLRTEKIRKSKKIKNLFKCLQFHFPSNFHTSARAQTEQSRPIIYLRTGIKQLYCLNQKFLAKCFLLLNPFSD